MRFAVGRARLACLLWVSMTCLGCKKIEPPTFIAFQSDRDGSSQIYVMKPDGTGLKRLTNDSFTNEQPMLSPSGLKVAFRSNRSSADEIWSALADGSGLVQLTHLGIVAGGRWSPNGNRIAFSANIGGAAPDIHLMKVDGSGLQRLTTDPNNDIEPSFSPDAGELLFTSTRTGNSDIYVMNVDGSGQTQLTTTPSADAEASFSPDGKRVVFWSNRDGNGEIYIMNADGTGQVNLTNNAALDFEPIFAPRTDEIAFMSNRDGNREIYVMNADGTNLRRLTNHPASDDAPDWK